ncbi:hypothetical protein [Paraburkholderia aspalathi]|uniref:hypothetical protein n=1 Tax=Paraburkholderia aspalathi TaxID=1324617 RepID=UPI0038B8CEDC
MANAKPTLPRLKLEYQRVDADWNGMSVKFLVAITVDGKICPFFVPESRLARRAEALWIIRKDLHLALEYCSILIEHLGQGKEQERVNQSLWQSAVMAYARCFVSASEGRIRLEEDIFKQADSAIKLAHARAIELRHKYIAHSTGASHFDIPEDKYKELREIVSLHVALNPNEKNRQIVEFYYDILFFGPAEIKYAKEMRSLIEYVVVSVNKKLEKTEQALLKELETEHTIDDLYEGAVRQTGEVD